MELISNLKYDVFLVYTGIILLGGSWWIYYLFNPLAITNLMNNNVTSILFGVIMWIAVYILATGISELRENYLKEKELINLRSDVETLKLKKEKEGLINK